MSKKPRIKAMGLILREPHTQLQSLVKKVRRLSELEKMLQHLLANTPLGGRCHVVNWREGCLVIAAENASVSNLLRYQCPQLLSQFRQSGLHELQSITCHIQSHSLVHESSPAKTTSTSRVSPSTQQFIRECFAAIKEKV